MTGGIKMKKSKILGYGAGSLGKDFVNIVISSYLLIYYTNVLGISAAAGGTIMMVTKIWDAINDPMMGILADKTRTRWGRFRPYLLFVPIPLAVCSVLTFTPVDFTMTGKIIWAAVTYTLTSMLFTSYDVPILGMVPSLSSDSNERNALVTSSRFFTTVAMLLGSTLAYPMIQWFGGGSQTENLAKGYPKFLAAAGVVSVIFAWIAFASTKEVVDQKSESLSVKKLLGALKDNKAMYMLQGANLFLSMGMMVSSSVGTYYVMYVVGKTELVSVYMFATASAMTVITLFVPPLLKRMSKQTFITGCIVIVAVVNILLFITGGWNIPGLLILSFISSGCAFAPAVVLTTMISDVADYTEYEKGYRADGVLFSINSFVVKLATAVNSGVIGWLLTYCGYDAALTVQSPVTVSGINLVRYLYPIAALVICLIFVKIYPLTDREMKEVRQKINERGVSNAESK